jgi:hypothetical protein
VSLRTKAVLVVDAILAARADVWAVAQVPTATEVPLGKRHTSKQQTEG